MSKNNFSKLESPNLRTFTAAKHILYMVSDPKKTKNNLFIILLTKNF